MTITFAELGLARPLLRALEDEGYARPTPIQERAIPVVLDGADLLGIAQTGTGKTAAFTLPMLQNLDEDGEAPEPRGTRALVLAPTRELALQISESIGTYGRHLRMRCATVIGGVNARPQVSSLSRGVDILVATPGRLIDLVGQRHVDLRRCEYLIIDEADRMLDMGFVRDVRRIVKMLPDERQTLMFSATMPAEIGQLANEILFEPERVEIAARSIAVERIEQQVHHLPAAEKRDCLARLLRAPELTKVIVFTRTKRGADHVVKRLAASGIAAEGLHGNKSQNARQRTLDRFRCGRLRVLVATDIASRGLDVDDISHIINYELPHEPESYVHRIGRTARAGADGVAISLCDPAERPQLRAIEKLIKRSLTVARGTSNQPASGDRNANLVAPPAAASVRPRRSRKFRRRAA